jgi:hypothetical protein
VFHLLQTIIGFQPDAPRQKLYIDPVLPQWLPDLMLIDLPLGEQKFDLRFWREGDATRWEVLKGNRGAVAQRNCASGSKLVASSGCVSDSRF